MCYGGEMVERLMSSTWHELLSKYRRISRASKSQAPSRTLHATLTRAELDGGWIAEVAELPGCMSQGETREEAMRNLIDAIGEVIAVRMSQQLPTMSEDDDDSQGSRELALCV